MRPKVVTSLAATVLVLSLSGCMFPQGWHWARTAATGSSTTQTQIYVKDDVVSYQRPYVAWIASVWNQHPELVVQTTDTMPPAGYNVIVIRTQDLPYPYVGLTSVGCCSAGNHIGNSTMRLDPVVGSAQTDAQSKNTIYHEFCHALGGGFTPPGGTDIHQFCNREYHALIWDEVTRLYHDDPG